MGTDNTFTDILTERQEHILRIKINRPQKKLLHYGINP